MSKRLFLFGRVDGRDMVEAYEFNGRVGIYVVTKNFNENEFSEYMKEKIGEECSDASYTVTINYCDDGKPKFDCKNYKTNNPMKIFRIVSNYFK